MNEKIRVTVRLTQYNPRPFIVKDPVKIAMWEMLAQQERTMWLKGYGIRIQRWVE